ncbi:MAG: dockerin type I repeat-containing protein [Prevotella sp.]|nr:dockerin type I repeat-containing protein [Candidatus Prevotella equi]
MKKMVVSILSAMIALAGYAQKDITNEYLKNPSFESDDITSLPADGTRGAYTAKSVVGWTLSGSYGVSDIMTANATATDNNFGRPGTPSDGKQMYYIRNAWAASAAQLLQKVTLPKGKYRITVDNKCITASSHSASLVAGSETTSLTFASSMPSVWNTATLDFVLKQESTVDVGLKVNFGSGSGGSIIIDNFKLYDISDVVVPEDPTEKEVSSHTEGIITPQFVPESEMKGDLLQMLADFSKYMVNDWYQCTAPNSINETCGYFNGENSGGSNEQGVRPNADLSMICAFLVKYGKPAGVKLPAGVTWEKIESMALQSLVFAYSTHKANKLKVCSGNGYWGSTSTSDAVWESSLWAMSVAYSAFFQWDKLTADQRNYIYKLLKAECNYELGRSIPTGYSGDTKAEENGWEADILAATLGMFPDDDLASRWFERLREFAINSYSHTSDANNGTVIDEWYDNKTVADLYKGANLYDDYSLQNHNLFHTSYQNVVMQELGEAALALKMFQLGLHGTEKWKTNALMHNNQEVQDSILNWLALADGELAMPNGNDWSLFLYDQITSYSTMACFKRDVNALMLENMAYKYIKARQKTTTDGSWLLRADVGARRMGVEAHRVMMTYLMHDVLSTNDMTAKSWEEFNREYSKAKMIPCQNVVRAATDSRFSCFSWSDGLKSYTGYFAANSADKNKIVVPYRANNTGNITGWYEVSGKATDATPVVKGVYQLDGNSYVMNGEMNVNGAALNNRFAVYSTPQNAIIYLDYVTAKTSCTITADKGGLLAISTDELMKTKRTLYYGEEEEEGTVIRHRQLDGATFTSFNSEWVNVDNELGIISSGNGKKIAFGDRGANNSIYTSKLYPMYSNVSRSVAANALVDARNLIYYSLQDAETTKAMAEQLVSLKDKLPVGWNGVIAPDKGNAYLLVSNFKGTDSKAAVSGIQYMGYAPVFDAVTTVEESKSSVTFNAYQNNSVAQPLTVFLKGTDVEAKTIDRASAYITAKADAVVEVAMVNADNVLVTKSIELANGETVKVSLNSAGEIVVETYEIPEETRKDYTGYIVNPRFEGNSTYGWNGSPTTNYSCAEKFNTTFNVYQVVKNLPKGVYALGVQGFYRDGAYATAASHRKAGTEKLNATLYANDSSVPMQSIFDCANGKGAVGVNQAPYGYIPDNMEQANLYFNAGLYPNALICKVGDDGQLTIGVKKTVSNANDWTIFSNFSLIYLGLSGDVNGDGKVDTADASMIVEYYLGRNTDINSNVADVNNDHKVSVADANMILNMK